MNKVAEFGEKVNNAGREFKAWFTDFTLVYTPIFVLVGIIMTGIDVYLNLGIATGLWFKIPWAMVQVLAVDGLWFSVWIRILTDEYKWKWVAYHAFIILLGLALTGIGIIMTDIVFYQQAMGLADSIAAMNFIGIPVGLFLHSRAVLLMATATIALILDKVMRSRSRSNRKFSPKSESIVIVPADKPAVLALPEPAKPSGYRDAIKSTIERYIAEGRKYTYQDIVKETGASLQTVKVHAPKIKQELERRTN